MRKIIYETGKQGHIKFFKLSRRKQQRWLLIRNLTTSLISHERIKTTEAKAKHMQKTANKVISYAIKFEETGKESWFRMVNRND